MPDYLDSIISQVRETAPVLRPRTPGLFEPVSNGYGPVGRLGPARSFSAPTKQEPSAEEIEFQSTGVEAVSRHTLDADGHFADHPPVKAHLRNTHFLEGELHNNHPASSLPLKPASSVGIPARLNELEIMMYKEQPSHSFPSTRIRHVPSAESVPYPSLIPGRAPVSDQVEIAGLDPDLSGSARPAPNWNAGELLRMYGSNEKPGGQFSNERSANRLKQLDDKLESLRPQLMNTSVAQSTPTFLSSAALFLPQETGRSTAAATPLLVHVNIGRVEIRATSTPMPPRPVAAHGVVPTSLEEYLRRRNGGSV